MKQVENLAHHTALINEWKKRTSCKKPKTNCFLTVSEINSHIQTAKWKYLETDTELYFVHEEENILYLYFYLPTGGKPTIEYRWNQPVMVDFVFREKETQELESETLPAWVHRGFTFYKKYQRMSYQHLTHGNTPWINADSDLCYKPAGETDLSQITDLWNKFLDKNDIILPSKTEILQQAEDENIICCMDGNQVCGAIYVAVNGKSGLIQHVVVHSDYRRKGIAWNMMEYTFHLMNRKGVKIFKLWVDEKNVAAIKLYEKNGFAKDGLYSTKIMKR